MSEFKPNGYFVDKNGKKIEVVDAAARAAAEENAGKISELTEDIENITPESIGAIPAEGGVEVKKEAADSDIIDGYFVKADGVAASNQNYVCTLKIPIGYDAGTDIYVRCTIIGTAALVFLDFSENVVLSINGSNASDYGITPSVDMQIVSLPVPAGAKYVRMSGLKTGTGLKVPYTQPSDFWISGIQTTDLVTMVSENTANIEENTKYIQKSDTLYGKKLAATGDSITQATNPDGGYFKNYAELVAERHGMSYYRDGIGGSTMANTEGHNPFCVDRYLNVPSDFDILTIWFGWNDATYSAIGTIEDTEDTTFYGAYKKVLEYFITTYPTKKIGLIVPYGNTSVEPFRVAVRALSEMYGVPCLDLADGKQCSLLWGTANAAQEARRAALTYDSTHPNQEGHEYLSTMYEEFIKRL